MLPVFMGIAVCRNSLFHARLRRGDACHKLRLFLAAGARYQKSGKAGLLMKMPLCGIFLLEAARDARSPAGGNKVLGSKAACTCGWPLQAAADQNAARGMRGMETEITI